MFPMQPGMVRCMERAGHNGGRHSFPSIQIEQTFLRREAAVLVGETGERENVGLRQSLDFGPGSGLAKMTSSVKNLRTARSSHTI